MQMIRVLLAAFALMLGGAAADAQPTNELTALVNAYRAQNGLGPVAPNNKLMRSADKHARDMARNQFMDHRGSDGSSHGQRAKKAGYRYCRIVENVAWGQKSAQQVMQAWMKSAYHRKNILNPQVKEIGAARGQGNYWVLVLGAKLREC